MKTEFRCLAASFVFLWLSWISSVSIAESMDRRQKAGQILDVAGIEGGLVVHVGCGDAEPAMELATRGPYIVHGLESDDRLVAKARAGIETKGLCGQVTVEQWDHPWLPYADELVNLIVVSGKHRLSSEELDRVLAPGGVALLRETGSAELQKQLTSGWHRYTKPRPGDIDEWTHYLYDSGNNAVSRDQRIGPPRHVRWKAGPRFARHHDLLASTSAMVSSQGRIFYIADDGPPTLMDHPSKWQLVARDAFNGVLLWKRKIPTWAASRPFRAGPPQLARRLVSAGDRVYVTLGADAAVSELDATTGNTLRTFPRTEGTDEILFHDGALLLVVGEQANRGILERAAARSLLAVDVKSGDTLWRKAGHETAGLQPATLAAAGKWVAFQCDNSIHCVERDTGRKIWGRSFPERQSKSAAREGKARSRRQDVFRSSYYAPTLVLSPVHNIVLSADGGRLIAYDLEDGERLWDCPCAPDFHAPADVFIADGLVWSGLFSAEGRDPRTGQVKRRLDIGGLLTPGHHPRCYRNKATDRFIISNKRGLEFFDLRSGNHLRNDWVRGQCQYGIMPANGLLYIPPNPCCCYPNAQIHGFYALASAKGPEVPRVTERLERGPAYGKISNAKSQSSTNEKTAATWPTYRGGETRSGSTDSALPVNVQSLWKAAVGGRLSSPVIPDRVLLTSSIDQGRIIALDASDGTQRWSFVAGGRVDTPPTVVDGLAVFGCADGWIYCLEAVDGTLAWRFRAAPQGRRIMVEDRLESVWPVHGSVLVKDGVAYAAAGRSVFLDGGITLIALDIRSGRKLFETPIEIFAKQAKSRAFIMEGVRPDILVTDGKYLYLQQVQFDAALKRTGRAGRHLSATSGFADDSWFYRTFWRLGTGEYTNDFPPSYVKHAFTVPMGQLLVFDDRRVCGLRTHMSPRISAGTAVQNSAGCLLFGDRNRPFAPDTEPAEPDHAKATRPIAEHREHEWSVKLTCQARAMVMTGSESQIARRLLFVAGWLSLSGADEMYAAMAGRRGGVLEVYNADTGTRLSNHPLSSVPVFDGMAAAGGKLFMCHKDGTVECLGSRTAEVSGPQSNQSPALTAKQSITGRLP